MKILRTIKNDEEEAAGRLADLGMISRVGDRFRVTVPTLTDGVADFFVRRDESGEIRCTCGEGAGERRCLHMLAVRAAIRSRRTETRTAKFQTETADKLERVVRIRRGPRTSPDGETRSGFTSALERIDRSWAHAVRDIREVGGLLVITVAITAAGTVREGIGTAPATDPDAFVHAESAAISSAAEKFRPEESAAARAPVRVFPSNPIARSLFDLVTAKQLGMIRAMSRELGLSPDAECREIMDCAPDELSKRAASAFIGHLLEIRNSRAAAPAWRRAG